MYREIGKLYDDEDKIVISNNLKFYVLNKFDGEKYYKCWEVLDENGHEKVDSDKTYTITEIYEIGESGQRVTLDYEIREDEKKNEEV